MTAVILSALFGPLGLLYSVFGAGRAQLFGLLAFWAAPVIFFWLFGSFPFYSIWTISVV